jgi:hypothetical protein
MRNKFRGSNGLDKKAFFYGWEIQLGVLIYKDNAAVKSFFMVGTSCRNDVVSSAYPQLLK